MSFGQLDTDSRVARQSRRRLNPRTRQLVADAFRIPGGSMEPTLLVGDWLFLNKLRFGPHVPFTDHSLPGYASPRRGDIVVFTSPPQDVSIRIMPDDVTPTLVERIVGIAGDTPLMRRGQLMVNGAVVSSPNAFVLADSDADVPQAIFAWQHQIEIRGSRFGLPSRRRTFMSGPARRPRGHVLHDGRQPTKFGR